MSRTISVTIPHELGVEGAKARLTSGLEKIRTQFGAQLTSADVAWTGDHADIRAAAMGQSVNARLDVLPDCVKVDVDLPWMLAAIAGKVQGYLQGTGAQMLKLEKR